MSNIYVDNDTEQKIERLSEELGSEMASVPKAKIVREAINEFEENRL